MTTAITDSPTTPTTSRFTTTQHVLTLNIAHPLVSRAIRDPQTMHRLVMSGFYGWVEPTQPDPRAQMQILSTWNLDLKSNHLLLIVQARVPADWSGLPRTAHAEPPATITVDTRINTGDTLRFRTVINPTRPKDVETAGGTRTTRICDTRPDNVRAWLTQRLQPADTPTLNGTRLRRIGADTDPAHLNIRTLPTLTFTDRHQGMRLGRAEITGTLTVTNPHNLTTTLTEGLGKARAYSCGLILIRHTTTE